MMKCKYLVQVRYTWEGEDFMSTDPTKYPKLLEPTQAVYYNPYAPKNPYDVDIAPPPPPKQGHKGLVVALTAIVCLIVLLGGILFAAMRLNAGPQAPQASGKPTQIPHTVQPTSASIPVFRDDLSSIDSHVFIPAWTDALATHNIPEIAAYTDQKNFRLICVEADNGCDNNWPETQGALESLNLQLSIGEPYQLVDPTPGVCPDVTNFKPHVVSNDIQYVLGSFTNNSQLDGIQEYSLTGPAIFEFAYTEATPTQTPYNNAGAMLLEAVYLNEHC
jgi:hypothetical protein